MDPLEGMPEFDKPENIPLVVPDLTPATTSAKRYCIEKNKQGGPCKVPPLKGGDRCLGHAKAFSPELSHQWKRKPSIPGLKAPRGSTQGVKTRAEILAMLSKRLDLVDERFGQICNPEVEQMICDICRTIAVVMKIEVTEDVKVHGWRMKGTA